MRQVVELKQPTRPRRLEGKHPSYARLNKCYNEGETPHLYVERCLEERETSQNSPRLLDASMQTHPPGGHSDTGSFFNPVKSNLFLGETCFHPTRKILVSFFYLVWKVFCCIFCLCDFYFI